MYVVELDIFPTTVLVADMRIHACTLIPLQSTLPSA